MALPLVSPVFMHGPGYPHPSPYNDQIIFRRLSFNLKVRRATADPWRKTGDLECPDPRSEAFIHEAHS
jgi:hypothetical protein